MNRIEIVDKTKCCGCGACQASCPKSAIQLKTDSCGFLYPEVDNKLCIDCGLCKKVCMYESAVLLHEPLRVYAAASAEEETLKKSASGGIFYEMAKAILQKEGVVYGCAYDSSGDILEAIHVRVDHPDQLVRLQGSKYVQSSIVDCYARVKQDLKEEKTVLFSGTPCQIGALYACLGRQDTSNLYTIDIICHGVPNMTFFQDYVKKMEKSLHGRIRDVRFRDKTEGWGLKGSLLYEDKKGNLRKKKMPLQGFSYYKMFLDSDTYRESCYTCLYAGGKRISDMTIGDYWGIEKMHPEFKAPVQKGVSCIIVNTAKGQNMIESMSDGLVLLESSMEAVVQYNQQLKHPSKPAGYKDKIFSDYAQKGYGEVEKNYYKRFGIKAFLYRLWNYLPGSRIDEKVSVVRKNEKCD